jgi:HEAT repeat protein
MDRQEIRRSGSSTKVVETRENKQDDHQSGRFDIDADLTITHWDQGMVSMTGLSAQSVSGKSLAEIFPELGARGLLERFHRVLQEGTVEVLAPSFHGYLISCPPLKPSQRFDRMKQRARILPVYEGNLVVGAAVTLDDVTSRLECESDLAEQLASADESGRLKAAQALAHNDPVRSIPPLVDAIGDSSWQVRRIAVESLKRQAGPDGIEEIIRLIRKDHCNLSLLNSALKVLAETTEETLPALMECLRDNDAALRMQVLLVLGEQGNVQAIPVLLEALDDPEKNVQFHAIEALGKLKARDAVNRLMEFASSGEFFVGFAALLALGQIGDPSVSPRIIPLLTNEALAAAAAETLGMLGQESAIGPLVNLLNNPEAPVLPVARAILVLYDRLEELGEGVRIADFFRLSISPRGIRNLQDTLSSADGAALRPLVTLLGWVDDPGVSRTLVDLLGQPAANKESVNALVRRGTEITELLLGKLDSTDLEVRRSAVFVLGQIRDVSAIPSLLKVLADDAELRIVAADALARIGDRSAVEPLVLTLADPEAAIRLASVGALNRIAPPEMVTRVSELLSDPNPRVREAAVRIAGYYGYAADKLVEHCRDVDEQVRRAAVETLPFLDHTCSNILLIRALQTDVPAVRAAAAGALARCPADFATSHLVNALADKDAWVRYFAARSLAHHASPAALDVLAEIARFDPAVYVRVAAIEALGAIGNSEALAIVSEMAGSVNSDIAKSVAQLKSKHVDGQANHEGARVAPLASNG